jgi:E3 ubiquitin-protein ligase RNF115/126
MIDAGMYCHACHHQWPRGPGGDAIECPACHSASTEIVGGIPLRPSDSSDSSTTNIAANTLQITPQNDPRHFHSPQPQDTMGSADSTPTPAPSAEPRPAPPETDHEMSDAPPPSSNEHATGTSQGSNNNSANPHQGHQPQVVFFFPPVTFITTTIIAPNHGPAPSPTPHGANPTGNQTPAPAPGLTPIYGPAPPPGPAPADRPSTETRSSSFNFFPFNLFMPQQAPAQESPSAPPPTGANSPPSGTETPVAPSPAAAPENTHPDTNTHGAPPHAHMPPFGNLGDFFAPFAHVAIQGVPQPDGQHPQVVFTPPVLSLLRMLASIPALGGDAFHTDQDFERILGRLWEQSQPPQGAPPASQAAIDALEVMEIDDNMLSAEGGARCVVCVEDLSKGEKVTALPCRHFFHGECVVPWLKMHNTCPSCRGPVESSHIKAGKEAAFEAPQRATGVDGQQQQEGTA